MKLKTLAISLIVLMTASEVFADRGRRSGDRERLRSENRSRARAERNNRGNRSSDRGARADRGNRNNRSDRTYRDNRAPRRDGRVHSRSTTVRREGNRHRNNGRVVHHRYRPRREYYGTRNYYRPHNYRYRNYNRYYHTPYRTRVSHRVRYTPRAYYRHVNSSLRAAIYLNWILNPSVRSNGYVLYNNYPYFVHNGYRHRYSWNDTCNYQLFDKYTHQVVRSYWNNICAVGYNQCALDRDSRNERAWENRYECAETFRNNGYDFSRPTYDYHNDCYDYDYDSGLCYDNY
jgi:hypothetical protein